MSTVNTAAARPSARVKLLQALMTLDDHRSIPEHSVGELAAIAGVAKGSVYYQFGSKDELVSEMLVYGAGEMQQMMDQLQRDGSYAVLHESFRQQVRAAFGFLCDHPSFTGLVAFALAQRVDERLRTQKDRMVGLLAHRLRQLRDAAPSPAPASGSSAPVEIAATALLSAAVTLSMEHHTRETPWPQDESVAALVAMAEGTIGVQPAG